MTRGKLWVVATPLGHPDDLSPRAAAVLTAVAGVAAEDTRRAELLLRRIGAWPKRLVSCHDHNERRRAEGLVARVVEGADWALISDAGTPMVADPGYSVVRAALDANVEVVVVPGPCAAIAALVGSGLPTDAFRFAGFLPREGGPRRAALDDVARDRATLVVYEAPHRLLATLDAMTEAFGPRPVAVAFELTKTFERWHRGRLDEVADQLRAEPESVRGEATVVVGGAEGPHRGDEARALELAAALARAGVAPGVVRDVLAEAYEVPKRALYQAALTARGSG